MEQKYEIDILIYPEGNGKKKIYSISSIQFPNVVTQGDSIEEAKEMLLDALKLYLKEAPKEKERLKFNKRKEAPLIGRVFL